MEYDKEFEEWYSKEGRIEGIDTTRLFLDRMHQSWKVARDALKEIQG